MKRRYSKRKTNRKLRLVEQNDIGKRDFPLIRENILKASSSDDWETARREWKFTRVIFEDDEEFIERCQLCNQPNLGMNYEIVNEETGKIYLVGSSCITRFIIFAGMETQEASNAYFETRERKLLAIKRLNHFLPEILSQHPTRHQLGIFRETAKDFLGDLDNRFISQKTWDEFVSTLLGPHPDLSNIDTIRNAVFRPESVRVKQSSSEDKKEVEYWTRRMKVRRKRVRTTLVRPGGERPDKIDFD